MKVVLASESPNKRELLERAGVEFSVARSEYEERLDPKADPEKLAIRIALGKARSVAEQHPDAIIISSDVFVELDGEIMGKPKDAADAKRMLMRYPGRDLAVVCGLAVIRGKEERTFASTNHARFRKDMTEADVDSYIATGEPLTVSGPFKHQALGANLIDHIRGDHTAIVGLPIYKTLEFLRAFGVNPLCR